MGSGRNKTPLVGWHPWADNVEWLDAETQRRGGGRGVRSAILNEALAAYRRMTEPGIAQQRRVNNAVYDEAVRAAGHENCGHPAARPEGTGPEPAE